MKYAIGRAGESPDRTKSSSDIYGAPRSRFTAKPERGLVLGPRDDSLLLDLFLCRVMSRSQIQSLHFGSVPRCNGRLRQLFDWGYASRYYMPTAPYGAQALYSLGIAGVPRVSRLLGSQGLELSASDVRAQRCRPALSLMEHTLAIADVYGAFRTAIADQDFLAWERWLPERLCAEEFEVRRKDNAARWRQRIFRPDAYLRLGGQETEMRMDLFFEIDLGHTNSRQFQNKIRAHAHYLSGGLFQQAYGSDGFRTLVVTTGAGRIGNLIRLAESEACQLFWFTTFDLMIQQPLGAIWSVPFRSDLISLLENQNTAKGEVSCVSV
ncbi:hypothetical protein CCAX7_35150 [Capsulimonas corticalis]|uniref:Uncharacterized protein n=1 Tax=Capsulimonas corticalis TaxID=2219043 RepID=A0A402CY73_9BACT|nr:replication-relaxation family protein [Capsulimonas corticalis]BDI31464.1 hypothetical protein CCAX7_35150 [Capsulimonas corticalis]